MSAEQKHTPGPWKFADDSTDPRAIGLHSAHTSDARKVACVNYCAGISTETLTIAANDTADGLVRLLTRSDTMRRDLAYLGQQRDRLLAAAQAALHYMRLHQYADQAWADDLATAIAECST